MMMLDKTINKASFKNADTQSEKRRETLRKIDQHNKSFFTYASGTNHVAQEESMV